MTNRKTKIYRGIQLILAVALPVNLVIGAYLYAGPDQERTLAMSKFTRVIRLIRNRYVDDSEEAIGYDKLIGDALNGMLQRLDPYSAYYPPRATADFDEVNQGAYSGIGVELQMGEGSFIIQAVRPGGPADQAGLMAADEILAVDGKPVAGWSMHDLQQAVKGEPRTAVDIGIRRSSLDERLTLRVVRGLVNLPSVRQARMLNERIGYIHLAQFNEKSYKELLRALAALPSSMQGLVLDLRENNGGLLIAARDIASIFIEADQLIVKTIGRNAADIFEHRSVQTPVKLLDLPLVILINGHSASAAEILAGSLQDYGRALLVGETSFGKALVLDLIHLPEDNSSIHLASRYYYTPSAKKIHGKGITPDHEVAMTPEQVAALIKQFSGSSSGKDLEPFTDPQLEQAIKLLSPTSPGKGK